MYLPVRARQVLSLSHVPGNKTDPSRIVTSPEALLPESLLLIEIFNLDRGKNLNTNVIVLVGVKQVVLNLLPVR